MNQKIHSSITNKRNKQFATPVGDFTYRYLAPNKYAVGIELFNANETTPFLMASPEKALCDLIHLSDQKIKLPTSMDMEHYLFSDLRIEEESLARFRIKLLTEITSIYQDHRLQSLKVFIQERHHNA